MRARLPFLILSALLLPAPVFAAAIHDAAEQGDVAAIEAALAAGTDVNESDGHATALYYAVKRGHAAAAAVLIERGADVDAVSSWGPPLMPAIGRGRVELVELLLQNGADPNTEVAGVAALHNAADTGCLGCVQALIAAGADVNAQTGDGKTPLHLARLHGHDDVADYLLAHGVMVPRPAPIGPSLTAADAGKGQAYFAAECAGCHTVDPQGGRKVGPNLWNVVGRDKASASDMSFSETLAAWDGVWTYEDLNTYLYGPMLTTPGVFMEVPGVPDVERANVIAYLRTLSDAPPPLPSARQ